MTTVKETNFEKGLAKKSKIGFGGNRCEESSPGKSEGCGVDIRNKRPFDQFFAFLVFVSSVQKYGAVGKPEDHLPCKFRNKG